MTRQKILDNKPDGATHYFLVPNGSGDPYYCYFKDGKYYYFYSNDEIVKPHISSWIKPL
jgi:hypothetical protein